VLGPLIAQVAVVGRRVRDVARPGAVHDGLTDLGEIGNEPVDEHENEEHPHDAGDGSGGDGRTQTAPRNV